MHSPGCAAQPQPPHCQCVRHAASCATPPYAPPLQIDNCDYPGWDPAVLYQRWEAAFNQQPYRIALANKAVVNYTVATATSASRRVGYDISASWTSMLGLAYLSEPYWAGARPGSSTIGESSFYNDIELLQVGARRMVHPPSFALTVPRCPRVRLGTVGCRLWSSRLISRCGRHSSRH